jgi:DNA-binding MarR family transcriptional regulator
MKIPDRSDYLLFGGVFVLANKLQFVGDKVVEGLSTKQWFLTRTIMDLPSEPPPTIMQIARETDSTRQNVTKMLEKMERDGYVAIENSNSDHRSRCVKMTEQGIQEARQVARNAEGFLTCLFEGISQDELNAAGGVFLKMVQNLTVMQEEIYKKENSKV